MLKQLEYNKVNNPLEIYNNQLFTNRKERLKLLNINISDYKKWYENFNIVEYNTYIEEFKKNKIKIENDTLKFIKECKIPLILVSNSSPMWIDFILNKYKIKKYFKYAFNRKYIIDDVKKPNPEVIKIIENGINDKINDNSIVVGDSIEDYKFAQNSNLKFISMYNKIDDSLNFENFTELLKYINKFYIC